MKLIKKIIVIIIVLLVIIVLGRNLLVEYGVPIGAKLGAGISMSIGNADIALTKPRIELDNIKIKNPKGFPKGNMAEISQIYFDCRPREFLKNKVYINEVRFFLDKIEIIKNKNGEFNFKKLTKAKEKQEGKPEEKPEEKQKPKGKKKELQIDKLKLKIGTVTYKDYSSSEPKTTEFKINLDREYENITNPAMIGSLIFSEIMMNTTLNALSGIDMSSINDVLDLNTDDLKNIQNNLLGEENAKKINEAVKGATDSLKKLFK